MHSSICSFLNDALYHGLGNDNGLTVGILNNEIGRGRGNARRSSECNERIPRKEQIITLLRSVLTVVDCLAPAFEVRAYFHQQQRQQRKQRRQQQRQKAHSGDNTLLDVLTNIERIKFICRLAIVMLNYSSCYNQFIATTKSASVMSHDINSSQQNNENGNNNNEIDGKEEIDVSCISPFGILKDGGMFDLGCNDAVSSESERKRVRRMLYVGKRTGKKLNTRRSNMTQNQNGKDAKANTNVNSNQSTMRGWRKVLNEPSFLSSPKFKVGMLALGEFLNLVRPLYFIHDSRFCARKFDPKNDAKQQQSYMMKTWIRSLIIDILSCKSIEFGMSTKLKKNLQNNGPNYVGCGGNTTSTHYMDTSSEMTKDELYNRKMRLMLYLLRAPIFDNVTVHVAQIFRNILNYIPLIGKPLASYFLDLLEYWQQWHFMMER